MTIMPQTEDITVLEMVNDAGIPCDYSESKSCSQGAAEWVLYRVKCGCGAAGASLSCDGCKVIRTEGDGCVVCATCGEVTAPARLAYSYIEYINKAPHR